jgi:outer membrane receptor protein involved in Fe transport
MPRHWRRNVNRLPAAMALAGMALAHAQTSRGAVAGAVTDPAGAAVPTVHLSLTSVEAGIRLSTESNDSGLYRFDAVDPGVYRLEVTQPGFRTYREFGIGVQANRVTTVNLKLSLGTAETTVEVNGASADLLIRDGPLRGANFESSAARNLPLIALNPLSLARTLPGVTEAAGSTVWGGGYANAGIAGSAANGNGGGFSINGQRPRGNNYLFDGVDNNEVWLSGEEQVFTIADAVEEVSVQTGNFSVEFGRAGGGVVNLITRTGANRLHGTLLWRYQSERFNSVSNVNKLNEIPQSVFDSNIFGFTVGGPVRRNRIFFFAAFQQNNTNSTANYGFQVPTGSAAATLASLFPGNPRLATYLNALGNIRGLGEPFPVTLGIDPLTGADRGSVYFATAAYSLPANDHSPELLARIDYYQSEKHRLTWRYTYDARHTVPQDVSFPGFVQEDRFRHQNLLFTDSYTLTPTYLNEFRFSYARPDARLYATWPGSAPAAQMLPNIQIANVSAPGLSSANSNFHDGNSFLFEDTQTKLAGRHAFRFGAEIQRQQITQQRAAGDLGSIIFNDSGAYSAFANFLDDFSGPSGAINRVFGSPVFHPNQLNQTYFLQDNWKPTPSLALTLGLRYENFSQYANTLAYPAFAGFGAGQFLARHKVSPDNNNFGPAVGFAWSPHKNGHTVLRGGYQIGYDQLPTQLVALGPASSSPNAITDNIKSPNIGRGYSNWYEQVPASANAPSLMDSQMALDGNLRSPYTERWSFGFQRAAGPGIVMDVSYVGSESHDLTTRADWNPRLPTGTLRLHPDYGQVIVKTSEGNSSYHALQARADRRMARGFQLSAAYTWSKTIDSTSDGVGNINTQDPAGGNLTSVPVMYGGLKLDRAVSDFDRPRRLTLAYLWMLPGPRSGWRSYALGGWQMAGIATFQSGTPFSVANGFDRNNYADKEDRADIGNPMAPLNTRAIVFPSCASGYQNPDTLACVTPGDVHWIEGIGFPNLSTVGRNTLRTGGTNNFDLNLTKSIPIRETAKLELRWEALNAFNHPQFVNVPPRSVFTTPQGQFLNRNLTDSGIRSMWVQVKVVF